VEIYISIQCTSLRPVLVEIPKQNGPYGQVG
jgi:hypothetical protein